MSLLRGHISTRVLTGTEGEAPDVQARRSETSYNCHTIAIIIYKNVKCIKRGMYI